MIDITPRGQPINEYLALSRYEHNIARRWKKRFISALCIVFIAIGIVATIFNFCIRPTLWSMTFPTPFFLYGVYNLRKAFIDNQRDIEMLNTEISLAEKLKS